jgi:hypothetical protein
VGRKIIEITTDIILIDVVGYSLLTNEEQLHTVEIISQSIPKLLSFMSAYKKYDIALDFIPTGDGVYIILNHNVCGYGVLLGLGIRNHLLWTSTEFLANLYKGVRVAIHMGKVLPLNDINGNRNYVGDGLNDCARLLSSKNIKKKGETFCGDQNYVVASESAFYRFSELFKGQEAASHLSIIKFKKSHKLWFGDKHKKRHKAYLVESSRQALNLPPWPSPPTANS